MSMVSGHRVEAPHWTVEMTMPPGAEQAFEYVHADRVEFKNGVMVFEDGKIVVNDDGTVRSNINFVTAYAINAWVCVWEQPNRADCAMCQKRDDE